jgi:hypothetical protein
MTQFAHRRLGTVIAGDDYEMEALDPGQSVTLALTFDSEPIWVTLFTHA